MGIAIITEGLANEQVSAIYRAYKPKRIRHRGRFRLAFSNSVVSIYRSELSDAVPFTSTKLNPVQMHAPNK